MLHFFYGPIKTRSSGHTIFLIINVFSDTQGQADMGDVAEEAINKSAVSEEEKDDQHEVSQAVQSNPDKSFSNTPGKLFSSSIKL